MISEIRPDERAGEEHNVLGAPLAPCSGPGGPTTGFFRDGSCRTCAEDVGSHTVCAIVTEAFLAFTRARGNDLETPRPYFPGLKPGNRWCLCAARWLEAHEASAAPPVVLEATHQGALEVVPLDLLRAHAAE